MRRPMIVAAALSLALTAVPAAAAPDFQEVVVVLHSTDTPVPQIAKGIAESTGGEIGFVYTTALQGFTLTLPSSAIEGLSNNPHVAYIEPVYEVQITEQTMPTGMARIEADYNPTTDPMDVVQVAVLDTGIYLGTKPNGGLRSHTDLNVQWVSDCTGAIFYPDFGGGCSGSGNFQDGHGHGTHVAGIIGAYDNEEGTVGVAPGVVLWSFKVLWDDGTGTTGMILAGIDGVTSKADQIDVGNMSLGFAGFSQAIDDSLRASTDAGVVWVVAAGNDSMDTSGFSPASSDDALAVSAIADFDGYPGGLGAATCRPDVDDTLADFSNYGPKAEIAAPGVCILSAGLNDGTAVKSGTSMAAPHVAGAIARYIAETGHPTNNRADVEAIKSAVIGAGMDQTSACGFTDVDSTPEPLLFLNGPLFGGSGGCESAGSPPPNSPPTASFNYSCTDLTCDFTNTSSDPDVGDSLTYSWDFGDGTNDTSESPRHTYAAGGTHNVTLTATDTSAASDSTSQMVTVSDSPPSNTPPTASFTFSCTDLTCDFTNTSTDPDSGDSLSYVWDFGDGNGDVSESPSHTYGSGGPYTVTLTVTDTGSASDVATDTVNPTDPAPSTDVVAAVYPILHSGRDAEVRVGILDGDGNLVGGALVTGEWTYQTGGKRPRIRTATVESTSLGEPIPGGLPVENAVFTKRMPKDATVLSFCVTDVVADHEEDVRALGRGGGGGRLRAMA